MAISLPPLPESNPKGRAVTVRPTDNKYKEKSPSDILQDLKRDLLEAVGVRPLRSGDIRVVFKDTKTRDHALLQGATGDTRVLCQDFLAEVSAVPLTDVKIKHERAAQGNHRVISQITKENKYLIE